MALKTAKKKDPSAVALGRKGGKIGGPARAARLTAEQRSESARKAVEARWGKKTGSHKAAKSSEMETPVSGNAIDTSDSAMLAILELIKATTDPAEIRRLSSQLERVIFHKQFENSRRKRTARS